MKYLTHQNKIDTVNNDLLIRVLYSSWDFQQALSSLTFLLEECNFDKKYNKVDLRRFRCYESSMVISFTRPFISTRNNSTLSLKKIGTTINIEGNQLKNKIEKIRNNIIAHSNEDYMLFKSSTFMPFDDNDIYMPYLQYNEKLHFDYDDFYKIEVLLNELISCLAKWIFEVSQRNPSLMECFKKPNMIS